MTPNRNWNSKGHTIHCNFEIVPNLLVKKIYMDVAVHLTQKFLQFGAGGEDLLVKEGNDKTWLLLLYKVTTPQRHNLFQIRHKRLEIPAHIDRSSLQETPSQVPCRTPNRN